MNYEEFLRPSKEEMPTEKNEAEMTAAVEEKVSEESGSEAESAAASLDLDVQKAVVESLAADKAVQDEHINSLRKDNNHLNSTILRLKEQIAEMKQALEKVGDLLAKNAEGQESNKIALLDRNPDLPDRFEGETRDHVIEVLREARDAAERDGRLRRAQVLEAVLVDNEPNGQLAKKRAALEKLFADNQNIVSGPVINELDKMDISYKVGDNYLLPKEIINRTY